MKLTINIDNAIEALEKNLAEHIVELEEAVKTWSSETITAIEEYRDAVTRSGVKASYDKLHQLSYARPVDSRSQYSRYIGALKRGKLDGQTHVDIDEDDYDRMFNDNWDWRVQSKTSNAAYTRSK